ncbi:MraY family glycosyltransferase [Sphingosinicella soli]|uniref:UDP-GlcNAc:undecaprenyl-phosphate GlcNAc-1-phosphate transferase n=1 Tax=Sphingosinicella soli TaxID=333708 RepID=A0A7W7B203_9SPHN|nr:MraY family glycosyltransferase [Sphingosinicella soli]MBB4632516.1 UDP-GlcNAc:undecaprenyl-phosphate GlcNAc-1-phosphate transferase [Sphingosinicella soli]
MLCAAMGIGIAFLVGRNAGRLGSLLGLLDYPDPFGGRKRHARVTPLVGGVAVVVAFEVSALLLYHLLAKDSALLDWQIMWLGFAVGAMALVGLADDRMGLSPIVRLALTAFVLILTILEVPDLRVSFLRFAGVDDLVLLPAWASVAFTLVCLIGLLNAVNMADGKNGIVLTLSLVWTAVLFARNPQPFDPLLFGIAGSLAVMLWFNMKGTLFLGDGGSYGISAIFGLLAIYAYNHNFATFDAGQVALLFLVPVLDTVRLMAWRIGQGRSPFAGDRNHLHHYLHARWGWPAGLGIYATLAAVPNFLGVAFPAYSLALLGLGAFMYAATLFAATRGGTVRRSIRA